MVHTNSSFNELNQDYIFPIIEEKLLFLQKKNPTSCVLNLGIGDVALPLVPSVCKAICNATQEMTTISGMRGYGPSTGYSFLKEAISKTVYQGLIEPEEIFISEGTNNDATNILEIFDPACTIGIPDPTYPAYLNSAIIAGKKNQITLLPCTEETGFVPVPPKQHLDIIYLCTPSNPTGVAMNRSQLQAWITYAKEEKSLLIIDNAYEAFVTSPDVPRSIYAIEGAKDVAIELRSFSKSAGFTALRCAYAALPKNILKSTLHPLWQKRQSIKSNGVPYIIQKGAEAALSSQGLLETEAQIRHYQSQAKILREGLDKLHFSCVGGIDAPYIWWKVPTGKTSWEFFDTLLNQCHLISIPGCGFGSYGEGFIRLSAFTSNAHLALERITSSLSLTKTSSKG